MYNSVRLSDLSIPALMCDVSLTRLTLFPGG